MGGKTREDIAAEIEATRIAKLTPAQREVLIQEATRTLPTQCPAVIWFKKYVERGLNYKALGKIMMGRRSATQIRKGAKKAAPSPYGYEPGDKDYSGEIRR